MSTFGFQTVTKAVEASATALHDGTNAQGHPLRAQEFTIQTDVDVFIGGSGVTDDTDGLTICAGDTWNFTAPDSRGTPSAFDLSCIYYTGGPFKLIIRREVRGTND